jgi:hypothetical protein
VAKLTSTQRWLMMANFSAPQTSPGTITHARGGNGIYNRALRVLFAFRRVLAFLSGVTMLLVLATKYTLSSGLDSTVVRPEYLVPALARQ